MLSLAISSSTGMVSVAVGRNGVVVAERAAATDRRHAEELTPMLAEVLAAAECRPGDLDRLVVDVGPGRFTGLRVGVTTARTMAMALDLEVVPVTSLQSLAHDAVATTATAGTTDTAAGVLAVVDARRSEVFAQRFVAGEAVGGPVGVTPEAAAALAEPGDVVVGDGADRYAAAFAGLRHLEGREPLAATMLALAEGRPAVAGTEVEPAYLRDPDVQVNIKTRHTHPGPRAR